MNFEDRFVERLFSVIATAHVDGSITYNDSQRDQLQDAWTQAVIENEYAAD